MKKTIFDDVEHLEKEAVLFGFQWETKAQIMAQIRSECLEIEEHLEAKDNREALQDEIGDLLHAVFSLCTYCNFDTELTLRKSLDKFEHSLNAVRAIAKEQGLENLQGKSFDELMRYWEMAKQRTMIPESAGVRGTKKALQLWEKVTQKELILNNVWCGQCNGVCRMISPITIENGRTITLEGECAACGVKVARYLDEA
ncbi:MazG nucleotide pyrophosphohydrolase domain-containing protein [Legionella pneumophila serogroup 1]|uniref:Nucleotide pyrophosphohydrolase n=1 Tax=Legionella pneumophila TaxID=446 RepID=A0AAN5T4X3_LEGPN|nr:MazG nucleotide pyrophosphohydrolase domain-containing protein [Legionella pneumophila]AMV14907.1 Nucleoside triphosphate pyrophosphohydrolase [Legionella pneumophila]ANN93086.1 nucleotide pyrophosphohydrolase [Legionella pneumophila]MCH9061598.1 nucleotide pyrophosphohydrolase [Legionella pneumophila serogroup 1]MCH9064388.1 nucleotide pyrophosphohydrolase [Legionella pneumophila serogroup 1]MCH9066800.1 nucleotide pyrophosphohydrolase [Legionella pneumophila serogroup 1]